MSTSSTCVTRLRDMTIVSNSAVFNNIATRHTSPWSCLSSQVWTGTGLLDYIFFCPSSKSFNLGRIRTSEISVQRKVVWSNPALDIINHVLAVSVKATYWYWLLRFVPKVLRFVFNESTENSNFCAAQCNFTTTPNVIFISEATNTSPTLTCN